MGVVSGGGGGGGGSTPGAARWIGPYTVGFADFDPDTFAAEIMTPTPGDLFLGGRFAIDTAFDLEPETYLALGAGNSTDGVEVPLGNGPNNNSVFGGFASTAAGGITGLEGPEVQIAQEETQLVDYAYLPAALIDGDAVNPRIYVTTNQIPTQGSARIWLCFSTPEAP